LIRGILIAGSINSREHESKGEVMARQDPLRNFRFRLEIDGLQLAGFSEVAIGETTTDVIDYREGTDPTQVRKLSGLTKFGNVMFKRGVSRSLEIYNWHKGIVDGALQANRRRVTIIVLEEDGTEAARFVISDAWPVRYAVGQHNARGSEVFIELLELANEGIERVG